MPDYRVLVVDSNPDVLVLIAFQLKQAGFEVYAAIDGARGSSLAGEYRLDLVFVDQNIVGLPCRDLVSLIRGDSRSPHAKIVLMTDDRWSRPEKYCSPGSFDLWIDKTQCATRFAEIAMKLLESNTRIAGTSSV